MNNIFNTHKIDNLEYLGNNYFFEYSKDENCLNIITINKENDNNFSLSNIASFPYYEKIQAFGINTEFRKIYAYLEKKKAIKIFNYDIEKKFIKLEKGEIYNDYDVYDKYSRCI